MKLTVFSYNIHSGKNIVFNYTLPKIIRFLRNSKADFIALQEVQNNSKLGWHFNVLERTLKMDSFYGQNIKVADGFYGNAIFSNSPMQIKKNHLLTARRENRGIQQTVINFHGYPVHCFNTHLSLGKKERMTQMDILSKLVDSSSLPTIVFGDFNTTSLIEFKNLQDVALSAGKEKQATVSPIKRRIDYILVSPHFKVIEYEVCSISYSDHFPIRAVLQLK